MFKLSQRPAQRTLFSALLRAIIMLVFGYVWWFENVVDGNGVALRAVAWFSAADPLLQDYAFPALPSVFQLFITEDVAGILGTPAMGFVSILFAVLDVIGPAYGWLLREGLMVAPSTPQVAQSGVGAATVAQATQGPSIWQFVQALVRGVFVSVIAQHIAWVNLKWLLAYLWQDVLLRIWQGVRRRFGRAATPRKAAQRTGQRTSPRATRRTAPTAPPVRRGFSLGGFLAALSGSHAAAPTPAAPGSADEEAEAEAEPEDEAPEDEEEPEDDEEPEDEQPEGEEPEDEEPEDEQPEVLEIVYEGGTFSHRR